MNLTAKTAALTSAFASVLAAGLMAATPALAAPADGPGPGTISDKTANSPTYLTNVKIGGATVKDADGIRWVRRYKDQWHSASQGGNCAKSLNVVQKLGHSNTFKVVDCKGVEKTFYFQVAG